MQSIYLWPEESNGIMFNAMQDLYRKRVAIGLLSLSFYWRLPHKIPLINGKNRIFLKGWAWFFSVNNEYLSRHNIDSNIVVFNL